MHGKIKGLKNNNIIMGNEVAKHKPMLENLDKEVRTHLNLLYILFNRRIDLSIRLNSQWRPFQNNYLTSHPYV